MTRADIRRVNVVRLLGDPDPTTRKGAEELLVEGLLATKAGREWAWAALCRLDLKAGRERFLELMAPHADENPALYRYLTKEAKKAEPARSIENPCMVCGEECSGPFEPDPDSLPGFDGDFWAYCKKCDAWTAYPPEKKAGPTV